MIEVCIATLVLHGLGFSAVLVSAFGMAHREAIANGFPDNLGTYALISALWYVETMIERFLLFLWFLKGQGCNNCLLCDLSFIPH